MKRSSLALFKSLEIAKSDLDLKNEDFYYSFHKSKLYKILPIFMLNHLFNYCLFILYFFFFAEIVFRIFAFFEKKKLIRN